MIERNIPRDITKYETRLIGAFTARQIVCFVPGIVIALAAGFFLRFYIGELAYLAAVVLSLPFFLCGAWKPYGIPLEKFIKQIVVSAFLSPVKRKFVIHNTTENIFPERKLASVANKKALKYKSKNADNKAL